MSDPVDSLETTVGPPASSSPVPVGHHDGGGYEQSRQASSAKRDFLPKKERIRRGRCRDKERIAKLRTQLSARDLAGDRSSSTCRPTLLEQGAVIRAATSAALASAVRQFASLEQAENIAADVRQALLDLAPFATVHEPLHDSGSSSNEEASSTGAEAVASAAIGSGSTQAGSAAHEAYEIFDADDLTWQTGAAHGPGLTSSADAAAGAASSLECASPAHLPHTVAANATTGLECASGHPEHHPSPVLFFGGGTSVKTLTVADIGACGHDQSGPLPSGTADAPAHASPRAFDAISRDVQLDFNSQKLADQPQSRPFATVHDNLVAVVGTTFGEGTSVTTPGTSDDCACPRSVDEDAGPDKALVPPAQVSDVSLNSKSEKSLSYSDTSYESCVQPTVTKQLCGPSATAGNASSGFYSTTADGTSSSSAGAGGQAELSVAFSQGGPAQDASQSQHSRAFDAIAQSDSNSQHLAFKCETAVGLLQCGPLPLQSVDSQNLANTCGEANAQHASPVLFDAVPESGASPAPDTNASVSFYAKFTDHGLLVQEIVNLQRAMSFMREERATPGGEVLDDTIAVGERSLEAAHARLKEIST